MYRINKILDYADKHQLYPDLRIVEGPPEPEVIVDGKKVLMFTSNNYLGLANHPKIIEASIQAIKKYGVGSDGSRLLSGNLKIHSDFEKRIADFKKGEDAIVWPSGYSANVGTISAFARVLEVGPADFLSFGTIILSDELNHASIIDGARLSKQKKITYKHCDLEDLESKLRRFKRRRKLVVTDSIFSMDGDIAPLDKIVELSKKYNATLLIDEAHATGVLGKTGHGSLEHFNLKSGTDVDITLGTCSKALASTGGFVVGSKDLVKYLRVASRSYMFSTAMMPAASAALIQSLNVIEQEPERRIKLWENANYLRDCLKQAGFNTLTSATQIIPILIGEDRKTIEFSRKLFERGIFAPAVRFPAVSKGNGRLRITVMSTHSKAQIEFLVEQCISIAKEIRFSLEPRL